MSKKTFSKFSSFIQSELGIQMPFAKKSMLEARISKRLRVLGIKDFDEYFDYVFKKTNTTDELKDLIDVITTNKTDFYRETKHFEYLSQTILPELVNKEKIGIKRPVRLWSAGCSTGEEPYTLCIYLQEFKKHISEFTYTILATDISSNALMHAEKGIYSEGIINPIPIEVRKKYLLRGKDTNKGKVCFIKELRKKIIFRRLNFMDDKYNIQRKKDIIFFRNVMIYFAREIQVKILNRLCNYLLEGGYIFTGHSETINTKNVPLYMVAPTIYKKI